MLFNTVFNEIQRSIFPTKFCSSVVYRFLCTLAAVVQHPVFSVLRSGGLRPDGER